MKSVPDSERYIRACHYLTSQAGTPVEEAVSKGSSELLRTEKIHISLNPVLSFRTLSFILSLDPSAPSYLLT